MKHDDTTLPDWLDRMEHTADEGIIVRAGDRKTLFARLAWGMFSILTDIPSVKPAEKTSVSAEGTDRDDLVVRWLSELNFLHTTQHRVFCRFDVLEADDRHVWAEVYGEAIDPKRHTIHTEIKAVTFHELKVAHVGGAWTAQVLFDV